MNIKSLKTFLHTYRMLFTVLALTIVFFSSSASYAHAQSTIPFFGTIVNGLSAIWNLGGDVVAQKAAEGLDFIIFRPLATLLYFVATIIGGLFIGVGGLLLDISITFLVVGMGGFFRADGGFGIGVNELWAIVRDILNIFFIFGFIYIGIKTILNSEDSGTRKTIGLLIIAALMINFSLYITQAIVDFSNIAATQVYNQILISTTDIGASSATTGGTVTLEGKSVVSSFMNSANISSLFGGKDELNHLGTTQIIAYAIFLLLFFILAGFAFLVAAIRLIYRFIALTLYMIFSPVMFLGWVLPAFADRQKKWWDGLLKNSFFAPAFLFLIYISLVLMSKLKVILMGEERGDLTALFKGGAMSGSEFTIFMFFAMMIGFIYASVKVGDMMGVAGAESTGKIFSSVVKGIRGGIQGAAYRGTVGFGLNKLVKGYNALDRAAEDTDGNKFSRGSARFARTIMGGESGRRTVEKGSNYGAGGQGRDAVEKDSKARSERAATGRTANATRAAIFAGAAAGATDAQKIEMENALARTSTAELIKMADSDEGLKALSDAAGSLPDKKFESLMESKDLTPKQKDAIAKARTTAVVRNLTTAGGGNFQKGVMGASVDQLNSLDFNELIKPQNSIYVQAGQLDKLESKWGDEKMRIFKEARKTAILTEFPLDPAKILSSRKGDKEVAKLPSEIFTTHSAILLDELQTSGKLTGGLLQSIAAETGMTGSEKKAFGTAVKGRYSGASPMTSDVDGFFRSAAGAAFGSI